MTKTCTILVGVPAAGKSTWISNQPLKANTYIASTDRVIEETAREYGMTYNEGFKDLIGFAETVMWRHIDRAVLFGHDIVIDRTNMGRKSRAKFINYLKNKDYVFDAVVFDHPEDKTEWNRRLNSRPGKTIPENAIQSMLSSFQFPSHEEGFRDITVINSFAEESM